MSESVGQRKFLLVSNRYRGQWRDGRGARGGCEGNEVHEREREREGERDRDTIVQ